MGRGKLERLCTAQCDWYLWSQQHVQSGAPDWMPRRLDAVARVLERGLPMVEVPAQHETGRRLCGPRNQLPTH